LCLIVGCVVGQIEGNIWIRVVVLIVSPCLEVLDNAIIINSCEIERVIVIVPDEVDAITIWTINITTLVWNR
jgi:hypothetical protein